MDRASEPGSLTAWVSDAQTSRLTAPVARKVGRHKTVADVVTSRVYVGEVNFRAVLAVGATTTP
jgi:hypothetical protein